MKKTFLFIICSLLFNTVIAQQKAIKITNLKTNKEKIIKENKRIILKTAEGKKIKGRFKIENNDTIIIDNVKINLNDIVKLKRNPLVINLFASSVFVYIGSAVTGFGILIGAIIDSTAFWLTIPGAGLISTGLNPPIFYKNYKTSKGWNLEIITISE